MMAESQRMTADGRRAALEARRRQRVALSRPKEAPLGACTAATIRCADARDYNRALRPCCRAHVRTMMAAIAEAFSVAGVTWWADYGTLLGAVRNPLTTAADYPWLDLPVGPVAPGIVPHDKDGDIGVLMRDWSLASRVLRRLAQHYAFDVLVRPNKGSLKLRLSRVNQTNVDVFFWLEKPDGKLYRRGYAQVDAFKGRDFHRDLLFPLSTVEWEGLTLPAPRDPEAFLEMRYGPNWRTPVMANHDGVKR